MRRSRSLRFDMRRLLSFPLLRPKAETPFASEGEILFELDGSNPGNLLFGTIDEEGVRVRLERAGILNGLSMRGYTNPLIVLECRDPAEQRISLFAGERSRERLLLEARLQLCVFHPRSPVGPFTEESAFRMIILHWLLLSDPGRSFTPERPRLPGQERPGLGILPQCISLLEALAREFALDGVIDVPDHYHTALFYSRSFRFLEAEAEGRFLAIARDTGGMPLPLCSEAIREGCLVDARTGAVEEWRPAEQVLAVRGTLRQYLSSASYRSACDAAFRAYRFLVDWDLYRSKLASKGRSGNYP